MSLFIKFLRLRNAWKAKANELDTLLAQESHPVRKAELLAEIRALKLCAHELSKVAEIHETEPEAIEGEVISHGAAASVPR